MTSHRTPSHRRILFRPALALAVALSCVAAPVVAQVEEVQAPSPVSAAGCTPAAPVDHAINTKGAGANDRKAAAEPVDHAIKTKGAGGDRQTAAEPAAPCAAPAEPVAMDHGIHAACQKAADKIACNRWEDYKATHKDD